MLSSFLNKSPLKVVTPFKYSMGLVNMVEGRLMRIVFYKYTFPAPPILPQGEGKIEDRFEEDRLPLCIILKTPWLAEFFIT